MDHEFNHSSGVATTTHRRRGRWLDLLRLSQFRDLAAVPVGPKRGRKSEVSVILAHAVEVTCVHMIGRHDSQ